MALAFIIIYLVRHDAIARWDEEEAQSEEEEEEESKPQHESI